MKELEKTIAAPTDAEQIDGSERARVCVIFEGEVDQLFVSFLVSRLNLIQQFVIIPTYGKYNALNNFRTVVAQYAKKFDKVIVLLDSDAKTDDELEQNRRQLNSIIEDSGKTNITSFFAHPSIEAWIAVGLVNKREAIDQKLIKKEVFVKRFWQSSVNHIRNLLMHRFSYRGGMESSHDFHSFVEYFMSLGLQNLAN